MAAGLTQTTKNSFDLLLKAGKIGIVIIWRCKKVIVMRMIVYCYTLYLSITFSIEVKFVYQKPGSEQKQNDDRFL